MTQEEANFINEQILPVFQKWKQTQVLKMTPEQNVEFRRVYQEEMGQPLPTCGNCVVEGMLSMIIRAEAMIEQKPKRKRRKGIEKTHEDLPKGDELSPDGLDSL